MHMVHSCSFHLVMWPFLVSEIGPMGVKIDLGVSCTMQLYSLFTRLPPAAADPQGIEP